MKDFVGYRGSSSLSGRLDDRFVATARLAVPTHIATGLAPDRDPVEAIAAPDGAAAEQQVDGGA